MGLLAVEDAPLPQPQSSAELATVAGAFDIFGAGGGAAVLEGVLAHASFEPQGSMLRSVDGCGAVRVMGFGGDAALG